MDMRSSRRVKRGSTLGSTGWRGRQRVPVGGSVLRGCGTYHFRSDELVGEELDWGVAVALRRERVPRVGVDELGEGGVDEAWAAVGHGSDAGSCALV